VVHALLKEIIPRYGIPFYIRSDNGPAFVAEVVKQLTTGLKIIWKLHTAYWPQNSDKVERMNQTLKPQMSKLSGDTPDFGASLAITFTYGQVYPTKQTGSCSMRLSMEGHYLH
jgi:hypothetical protein